MDEQTKIEVAEMIDRRIAMTLNLFAERLMADSPLVSVDFPTISNIARLALILSADFGNGVIEWED